MSHTHENFQSKISNRYGTVWLNKVKEFTRLRIKRKKLECGLEYVLKCRDSDLIPKFSRIKPVKCIQDYDKFFRVANAKLLRQVIAEYRRKLMLANERTYNLHLQLSRVLQEDMWQVLDAMSFNRSENVKEKTGDRHINKLRTLKRQQHGVNGDGPRAYPRQELKNGVAARSKSDTVINLSSLHLGDNAITVLSRGLNFAPAPKRIPVECIITGVEDTIVRNKIPHNDAECLRQDICTLLRRSKPPKSNITRGEMSALRDIRDNESILVLPADKGNATVVVDTDAYENKITQLVSDESKYKKVNYNPTLRVTTKVVNLLRSATDIELLARLRPHNPTPPKIYGLPKIHKPAWPLRPIVSQIDSPTYKLSKYVASILQSTVGKTDSYVKDSSHFVRLLQDVRILPNEIMVSFDVASLFTNVPVDDTIDLIRVIIQESNLPSEYIEWTELCLRSGYFMWRGDFYLQVDGVAMGSPIAPVVANIFMEWFEGNALSTASMKPRHWWRYVDDIFAIITRDELPAFTRHLNSIHCNITITLEEEREGMLPFLDLKIMREADGSLSHTVYRKPTHTDRYLHADSHHHPAHLSSVPRTLINRALRLCDPQFVQTELEHVRGVLEDNGYSWRQCLRWVNPSERRRPALVERSPAYLPFVKGVTDSIGYLLRRKYGIRTVFRPPGQLRQLLRSPKDKDHLNVPGVYRIPCDCGQSYIGETRRNVTTRLTEHIRSVKNMDTARSALAEHALLSDTGHYIRFDKASVLAREKFYIPRKVREAIEISRFPNFNRDRGWAVPPAWIPILNATSERKVFSNTVHDTVSCVCLPTFFAGVDADDEDDILPPALGHCQLSSSPKPRTVARALSPPPPNAPPLTRREARARARSARRDLLV